MILAFFINFLLAFFITFLLAFLLTLLILLFILLLFVMIIYHMVGFNVISMVFVYAFNNIVHNLKLGITRVNKVHEAMLVWPTFRFIGFNSIFFYSTLSKPKDV